jgi:olfactory receptor
VVDELIVALMAQLRFCVPKQIDHFYYDFSPLVVLAYTDTGLVQVTTFVLFVVFLTVPFGLVLISCAQIAVTVLRVPSRTRRNKAFSTCSSHLDEVSTFYGSLMVWYTEPSAVHSQILSKVIALLYTVVTTIFDPGIYTLRNQEVQQSLRRHLYCKPTEM